MKKESKKLASWALICAILPVALGILIWAGVAVFVNNTGNWAALVLGVLAWTVLAAVGGALAVGLGIGALCCGRGRGRALVAVPIGVVEAVTGAVTLIGLLG